MSSREEFVERVTRWLIDWDRDPDISTRVRASDGLDGVYRGKSRRIHALITLAYLRGVRRGAGCAWEAQQPVVIREAREEKS